METIARTQTVVRLRDDILAKARFKAKQNKMSLNAFFEKAIEVYSTPTIPSLPKDFKIDPAIERFSGLMPRPTEEQLQSDDRLSYIWKKGLEDESVY